MAIWAGDADAPNAIVGGGPRAPPEPGRGGARLAIIGFGGAGRELARLLALKSDEMDRLGVKVVAVADSRGAAICPRGFTGYELLKLAETPRSQVSSGPCGRPGAGVDEVYDETAPTIHVEVTPSDYETGEPGLSHAFKALRSGASFVTANKAPLALRFWDIVSEAASRGLYLGYSATVMAGTPLVSLLRGLRGCELRSFEGILNATTNYVLTVMQEKLVPLEEALEEAKAVGVAEPDPSLDLEGWDAAAKLVIVANTLGYKLTLGDVRRRPLNVSLGDVVSAMRRGRVVKYVARFTPGGAAEVAPVEVEQGSFLAQARGTENAVTIDVGFNVVKLAGRGGGVDATAHALLADIIEAVRGWVP
ncbi:homoserine dehydrogenase [Stetteria hydrogenophila]